MKRPTMLVKALLHNAALDLDLSVERDVRTLERRCKYEGLSFLTITLPGISDALEKGLETGLFSCPTSFSRHGALPRFLGGLLKRIFTLDGRLRDDACTDSILWVRQICRFFKKPKIGCSPKRNAKAAQQFVDVEGELRMMTSQIERKDANLDKVAQVLWSQVFPEIDYTSLVCHHGPGNTADKLRANARNRIRKWNQRSEFSFPSDLHCYPNYGYAALAGGLGSESSDVEGVTYCELKDEDPVRIVFVPKTMTAPRVIALEPSHIQYAQQSLKDYCYTILEYHPLTKHSIRFIRQDVNQRLACSSSKDKRLATLDLKDASDRVHLHLVQRIFKNSGILEYLEDCRSLHATLPDGRNIILSKFASMGSAMCFPVEACVFYTLIQSAMHQLDGIRPSTKSIKKYSKMIDIYGDDIIIPVEYTDVVVRYLESYALKVNINKSFKEGYFRESCGGDFYKGVPVNPVYARQEPHDDARKWKAEHVMAWKATADLFYLRGKWVVAQAIRDMLQSVLRRSIPITRVAGPGLAFLSFFQSTNLQYDCSLHSWKQKRLCYDPLKREDNINDDQLACLNKWGINTFRKTQNNDRFLSPSHFSPGLSPVEGLGRRDRNAAGDLQCASGVEDPLTCDSRRGLRVQAPLPPVGYEGNPSETGALRIPTDGADLDSGTRCPTAESLVSKSDYCLISNQDLEPLKYLDGSSFALDFQSSTKRGGFKSKRRWVTHAV